MAKKAVQKAEDPFKESIELHKKRGITTYTLTCKTGQKCLIREPNPEESAEVVPILQGLGFDETANKIKRAYWRPVRC